MYNLREILDLLKKEGGFVISGRGIGFGNRGGMKGRNRDWIIKSNYFLIDVEKRRNRVYQKCIL
jgi:hypothetical protein